MRSSKMLKRWQRLQSFWNHWHINKFIYDVDVSTLNSKEYLLTASINSPATFTFMSQQLKFSERENAKWLVKQKRWIHCDIFLTVSKMSMNLMWKEGNKYYDHDHQLTFFIKHIWETNLMNKRIHSRSQLQN